MRRGLRIFLASLGAFALVLPGMASGATPVSQSFTTAGEQQFVIPPGVTSVQLKLVGGHGAAGDDGTPGGSAATVTATFAVSAGETLYAEVAGNGVPLAEEIGGQAGGYGGGGEGGLRQPFSTLIGGGGGGGASDVRRCSTNAPPAGCGAAQSLASRLLVAGGGGGGGGNGESPPSTAGGNGGSADQPGSAGAHDAASDSGGSGGLSATSSTGGSAGGPSVACEPASGSGCPTAGQLGMGGAGGWGFSGGGGGGGGGIFGGGGGGGGQGTISPSFIVAGGGGGGGGGGSSGVPAGAAGVAGFSLVPTAEGAQPSITFTWTPSAPAAVTGAPSALTATTAALGGTVNPSDWLVSSCAFDVSPAPAGVAMFPCAQQIGAGSTPVPVSATAAGLTPNTTYTVTLLATSVQGTGSGNPVTFTTPSPAPPTCNCALETTATGPTVSTLKLSPTRFRRGKHAAKLAGRASHRKPTAPTGTTISFGLSTAATVTLSFQHAQPGQLVAHRCLAPSPRRRHPHRCTRYTPVPGAVTVSAHAGVNHIHFEGILDGTRPLSPGNYQLMLSASNAAGHTMASQRPTFTLQGG